jgi:DNA-3-methyladenine glycosylase
LFQPLPRTFYARETVDVARDLIGKSIVRTLENVRLIGRIVEAEAYRGEDDPASHASGGKTERNEPMYGPPGYTYVYFIYGMHWMLNLSAHVEGHPGAVLIRALEPVKGVDKMRDHRGGRSKAQLTNGPAKLAQALAVDGALNNHDLCAPTEIAVIEGALRPRETIAAGPRIRVPGDAEAKARPWRFWIEGHPYVSS